SLRDAVDLLLSSQVRSFLVVDPFGKPVGSLSREQLIEALSAGKSLLSPLVHVMDAELLQVSPTMPLHEGFRLLQEHQKPFLIVMQGGHLLGIVDTENIAEFLLVRQALMGGRGA
ncbi:MAG: CBS domain-containing protein, partial [Bacteroidia bacterium]|nr:CBS domain-containing protein [Bacteroidia bacterium]MDW8134530.1 CBS domain-containing protein [Bacteroidia bacterium]